MTGRSRVQNTRGGGGGSAFPATMPRDRANTCTLHVLCRHHTRSRVSTCRHSCQNGCLAKSVADRMGPAHVGRGGLSHFLMAMGFGTHASKKLYVDLKKIRKFKNYTSKHFCPCHSISSHSQLSVGWSRHPELPVPSRAQTLPCQ